MNYTSEQGNKKFTEITDNIKSAIGDVIDNLSAFQSSISLISTTLDSADTMIANTKKSIPDLEQLLAQSGTLTTSAKDSITAVQAVSTQITAATDTVLNSIDTLYSNTESSISDITGEIAADADKAAEKIRATAEINRKTIDALNNIRTHVVTVGEKLGIDVSIMTDAIDRNIEKQNAIIDKLNSGADTVSATGHAPDNFESDVNKLITDSKKEFDGIKTLGTLLSKLLWILPLMKCSRRLMEFPHCFLTQEHLFRISKRLSPMLRTRLQALNPALPTSIK